MINKIREVTPAFVEEYVKELAAHFPFIDTGEIGKSVSGTPILRVGLGRGERRIFLCGAHHGLESITTLVLLRFIEDLCTAAKSCAKLCGCDVYWVLIRSRVEAVPLVNPDGVEIAHGAAEYDERFSLARTLLVGRDARKIWQANARGVDLNHNYDANFLYGKSLEADFGAALPGPTRHGGPHPESEPETTAVCAFLRENRCELALSYHTQGSVIYYGGNCHLEGAYLREFCRLSGYSPEVADGMAAQRGFCDWFRAVFRRPAFTIEAGLGKNPLPLSDLEDIYAKNLPLLCAAVCGITPGAGI